MQKFIATMLLVGSLGFPIHFSYAVMSGWIDSKTAYTIGGSLLISTHVVTMLQMSYGVSLPVATVESPMNFERFYQQEMANRKALRRLLKWNLGVHLFSTAGVIALEQEGGDFSDL